jgi:GNAT superfamily N-acetyltransferase
VLRELASLVVEEEWRGMGVARALIEELLVKEEGTVYLTCRDELGVFYAHWGFRALTDEEMPKYYARLKVWLRKVEPLGWDADKLLVMKRS